MSTTQITTAARRIQRDLSTTPTQIATTYSPTGEALHISTGGPNLVRVHEDDELGWTITLSGEDRKQREIQELLDAAQWAHDHREEYGWSINEAFGYALQGERL